MPTFRPPYAYTWDPPAATTGSPIVINRGASLAPRGVRDFVLQSNATAPSSADLVTSFGVDAGVAGDAWNARGVPAAALAVTGFFDVSSLIFTSGTFASARAADWLNVYIEEFERAGGRFLGARQGSDWIIRVEDHWYFSGADRPLDDSPGWVASFTMPVVRGRFYRVWFDVHGSIRAAGFGGIGGSGARVQLFGTLTQLDVFFVAGG